MTAPTIGFYVHHEGRGHLDRTRAVIEVLGADRAVVATSSVDAPSVLERVRCTVLPGDVPDGSARDHGDVTANGALHWVPERPETAVRRLRALVDWVADTDPALVVVDVSVEVALQLRLIGIPVVVVRLPGRRTDPAHRLGYRVAEALLAPFPESFDDEVADDVRRRTTYCGHIAPSVPSTATPSGAGAGPRRVLVVWGQGTPPPTGSDLDAAAAATPGWSWAMVGPPCRGGPSTHVAHLGWHEDLDRLVGRASVVVGSAGDGTIGLVAAAGAGYVALPQPRPFDEQLCAAAHLRRLGLAVVEPRWPDPSRWPAVLSEASRVDPRRRDLLGIDGAAERAAELIDRTARQRRSASDIGHDLVETGPARSNLGPWLRP